MNLLIFTLIAVSTLSTFPVRTLATTPETEVIEEPKALPLQTAHLAAQPKDTVEIWQENDHEVLIRNERGAKDLNNGQTTTTGKKGKKDRQNRPSSSPVPPVVDLKTENTNTTQLPHHQKHKKTNKKNTNQNKKQVDENSCRYAKGPWTECDAKSNTRSRTLTLKKGEDSCVPTRTIQKKCKKACRYDKGAWSECLTGQMSRTDKLKMTSDTTCQTTRVVNKNCNKTKQEKNIKDRSQKDKNKKNNQNADRKNRQ